MYYKLFNESGDYIDSEGNECNMLSCNIAWTPDGINVGWMEFETDEQAMDYFGITKKENLNIV